MNTNKLFSILSILILLAMATFFLIKSGLIGSREKVENENYNKISEPQKPYRLASLEYPYASGNLAYSYFEDLNANIPFLGNFSFDENEFIPAADYFKDVPIFAQAYVNKSQSGNIKDTLFTEQNIPIETQASNSIEVESDVKEADNFENTSETNGCSILVGLYDSEVNADKIINRLKSMNLNGVKANRKNRIRVKVNVPCEGDEKNETLKKIRENFASDAYFQKN